MRGRGAWEVTLPGLTKNTTEMRAITIISTVLYMTLAIFGCMLTGESAGPYIRLIKRKLTWR